MKKNKIFVYLRKRDKRGIKLITILRGNSSNSKLSDPYLIGLPKQWADNIKNIAFENRMDYELWISCFPTYAQFREYLSNQKIANLPLTEKPMFLIYDIKQDSKILHSNQKKPIELKKRIK